MTKFCKLCKTTKSVSEFHPRTRKGLAIGYMHPCKICWNDKRRLGRNGKVIK